MKYVLCLAALAGLLAVTGCESEHHDGRGGYGNDVYYGRGYDHNYDRSGYGYRGSDRISRGHEGQWDRDYR
jgi:hypothetical protein